MSRLRSSGYRAATPLRRLSAHMRSGPGVIIGGAQKSGTTYLAELLASQPGFYSPPIKEIHFFNGHWPKGTSWYQSHFQLRTSRARQVDASPSYMIYKAVPARIYAAYPEVKLIFILRDPAARAYSHYQHNVRAGLEDLDFPSALAAEVDRTTADLTSLEHDPDALGVRFALYSYRSRGIYARYLEEYYRVFPRENILVLDADRVFANLDAEINLLESFLDFRLDAVSRDQLSKNAGAYDPRPGAAESELRHFFAPWDEPLADLVGRRLSWMSD